MKMELAENQQQAPNIAPQTSQPVLSSPNVTPRKSLHLSKLLGVLIIFLFGVIGYYLIQNGYLPCPQREYRIQTGEELLTVMANTQAQYQNLRIGTGNVANNSAGLFLSSKTKSDEDKSLTVTQNQEFDFDTYHMRILNVERCSGKGFVVLAVSQLSSNADAYQNGKNDYFQFSYPKGWNTQTRESAGLIYFFLSVDPIVKQPHFSGVVDGVGIKVDLKSDLTNDVKDFKEVKSAIESLKGREEWNLYPNIKELNWPTGEFEGKCFEHDTDDRSWEGYTKGNITCFVLIANQDEKYSFRFYVGNLENYIQKVDPDKKIIQNFFASLNSN